MHACVFCPWKFNTLLDLVVHLCEQHRHTCLVIGNEQPDHQVTRFEIVEHRTGKNRRTVLCLCGERFTLNQLLIGPTFKDWAETTLPESNSFLAHLRREGGLEKHVEKLRDAALLAKLASMDRRIPEVIDDDSW